MKRIHTWQCECWRNGTDYDEGKPSDFVTVIKASTEQEADDAADKLFRAQRGEMEVITSTLLN